MKSCIRRSAGSLRIYRARNKRTGDAVVRYYVLERVNGSQKWIHITEWNLRSNREAGCSVIFQTIKHRYRAPCCFFLLSLFRLVIADIQYVRLFSRSIDLGPRFWSPSRKSSRLERHRAILRTCAFSSLVFFLLLLLFFFSLLSRNLALFDTLKIPRRTLAVFPRKARSTEDHRSLCQSGTESRHTQQ